MIFYFCLILHISFLSSPKNSSALILSYRFKVTGPTPPPPNRFATVEVCVTCTALGFVLSWFGSAYGNIWIVGLRRDDWRMGGGQYCAEILFFMSLLALVFPAILKCRVRDYGFSRKPQLHPQVESLLGGRLMNGGCC